MTTSQPSAGRPLAFIPDAALEAAMRLFWERGFEATSVQDLERRMGLGRSSFYNSFGSKRALFERVLAEYERRGERIFIALEAGRLGLADAHAFFASLTQGLSATPRKPGCLMVNSIVEFGGMDPHIAGSGRRYFGRVQAALLVALRRAAKRGEIAPSGLEGRARLLLSIAMAMNVQARAGASAEELSALTQAARREMNGWRIASRPPRRSKSKPR